MIGASTRLFAVLGDPVAHSLSPGIHNPAIEAAGMDAVYVALRCGAAEVSGLMRGLAVGGGGGNVTLPHKEAAAAAVDEPSELVARTGACNTFWLEDGRLRGENTDVAGFRGAVSSLLGHTARGLRVLLLGAGGAARAAIVGLTLDGAASVAISNRTESRARQLAAELGDGRARVLSPENGPEGLRFDLVVNSTSLGLRPDDPLPFDPSTSAPPGAVLDLVYRPGETALVRAARAHGIPAADGAEMLVRQGAQAFECWWRRPAPLEAMRRAMEALRREGGAG
ncbi:MAG: shikimate dehydrogenase [Gammaproteobacteria bacterium]|nr:shikimate dehydrogenase [Gammaproteobacteria bacterium]MDE0246783.1 shikimate dehydrogenase [Gammaproteobacteria bacterium]